MSTAHTPVMVELPVLGADVLEPLVAGDLARAGAALGHELPPEFLPDTWLWSLRLGQLLGEPDQAPWLIRAILAQPVGIVVGHAGFHGPPDAAGMVEVGYRVVPAHRRRGYARATLAALLDYAREHGARTARASISPDNVASLALTAAAGFAHTGEQWDEIDGRELVFERPLT
ncbi:MAG TPA: GNAT family protein [Baekduia sp.]|nr:GNAT family protein [Baekduia sp.]